MAKTPTNNPDKPLQGEVVNSNDNILNNTANYLQYLRDNIKRIIVLDGLKYSEPRDNKKEYPDFTYTQFLYLLSRLNDEVYKVNTELLYNNYNKRYNPDKVKLCYEVYSRLCFYYGFNCSPDGFYFLTGLSDHTLKEWLSSGFCDVFKDMLENGKKSTIARFENSTVPILNLAAGNYKYKLNTPLEDRQEAAAVDVLPDLTALTQRKQGLIKAPEGN